ncbi:MAG: hypothetical protein RBQ77_05175 [Candidatus Methanomethylophilaceae archaeon]|nr:hypothetical protein [Candidatus Methanomethylophilaceae archaeon]NLF34022.1 hypothetical protein [Thermoplasmatales archaeon]
MRRPDKAILEIGEKHVRREIARIDEKVSVVRKLYLDESTRHDMVDARITRYFPYFLVMCAVLIAALLWMGGTMDVQYLLRDICLGFIIGFSLLGIYSTLASDRGAIPPAVTALVYLLFPPVAAAIVLALAHTVLPGALESNFVSHTGDLAYDFVVQSVRIYFVVGVTLLTINGVISVVVAYFRKYIGRVYVSIGDVDTRNPDRGGKVMMTLFGIPDIIDVESVDIEPLDDEGVFPVRAMFGLAFAMFLLGVMVCSNIFLNPYFIEQMEYGDMTLIATMLSLFLPVLVFPWQITKAIGVKVKSSARDYYVWKGMKRTIYQSFFTLAVFILLIFILMYLNIDFGRVLVTYLGYIALMAVISLGYSFLYFNRHYQGFKRGIIKGFYRAKEERIRADPEEKAEVGGTERGSSRP